MDFKELSYAEFSKRVAGYSVKDLRKMAQGYKIELPPGLTSAEATIRAMYDVLSSSVPASGADASSSSFAPPEAGPRIKVLCTVGPQFWFQGYRFTSEWQEIPVSAFTLEQLAAIRKHSRLLVRDVAEAA